MAPPTEPVIIAEQGALVVAEQGATVLLIDRGSRATEITAYVLVVCTLVFGGFGVVTIGLGAGNAAPAVPAALSALMIVIGMSAAIGAGFLIYSAYRTRRRALSTFTPVAVLDRAQRVYWDRVSERAIPLNEVRFERRMQVTSSSPKLVAVTSRGAHTVKSGNPFRGGIGRVDEILNAIAREAL
ncbi:MAG: hypothetical protein AB7G47_18910 [Mycolicibacterium sp.]|uniref:hypothetical protein n=1 Tax=Mycolicibacterium sp. TaxID=2320850 RepID=UPI003D0E3964